jgi:hypothetical protein
MALTVAVPTKQGVIGDLKYTIVNITWDSSYATGGLALTAAAVGLTTVYGVLTLGSTGAGPTGLVEGNYDTANAKLQAFGGDGAAATIVQLKEITSTTNLSAITSILLFIGK